MKTPRTTWAGLIGAVALGLAQPAAAQDIQTVLAPKVALLEQAVTAGDYGKAFDVLPPRLLQSMSDRFGMSLEDLRRAVAEAGAAMLNEVQDLSFAMHVDQAARHVTPDGARPYWLVPTETRMSVDGQTLRTTTQTLALEEDGEWYLIRVADPTQVAMLRETYPEFAGVEFPRGSVAAVP
ncbi:MAG: hypothetical protein EON89_15030 [Brevundimonas sp.]|nr:MAG: hypothetical protein EON89_15030 [Brevundimonas sp.]